MAIMMTIMKLSEIFQLRPGELLSMDLTNFIEKQKWWNPKTNLITIYHLKLQRIILKNLS